MKYCTLILLLALLSACVHQSKPTRDETIKAPAQMPDSLLIKPGKSVGNINVGDDMGKLTIKLGQPDRTDAAMGSALFTWFTAHDTANTRISTFGHRNFGGADESILHIKKILITSPRFATAEGIRCGSSRDSIVLFYKFTDSKIPVNGKDALLLADTDRGIGFELDSTGQRCKAIIIFKPRDSASAYINMY